MTRRNCYLLVEGQQDVAFIGRLFQEIGLHFVQSVDALPEIWQPLVDIGLRQRDQAFRARGHDGVPFWQLFKPSCLTSDSHSIVIERAAGNRAKFGRTLIGTGSLLDGGLGSLHCVGLLPDADSDAHASFASAIQALRAANLPAPVKSGEIVDGTPRTGILVLPGGNAHGGLEELLLDCAKVIYPDLFIGAQTFVGSVAIASPIYSPEDMREMGTPQGPKKAVVGSIASVLKPGSTVQLSIKRDRWISADSIAGGRVAAVFGFLKVMCGIE